jgi:phosphopantetheinyl transferase (holo-ACP synthase)
MPFLVQANIDDHTLAVTFETAKEAFAKAVEWQVGEQLNNVSINDGTKSYTVAEFSSVMALKQIADTVEADAALGLAHRSLPPC